MHKVFSLLDLETNLFHKRIIYIHCGGELSATAAHCSFVIEFQTRPIVLLSTMST
jgi:hypothetical protein